MTTTTFKKYFFSRNFRVTFLKKSKTSLDEAHLTKNDNDLSEEKRKKKRKERTFTSPLTNVGSRLFPNNLSLSLFLSLSRIFQFRIVGCDCLVIAAVIGPAFLNSLERGPPPPMIPVSTMHRQWERLVALEKDSPPPLFPPLCSIVR